MGRTTVGAAPLRSRRAFRLAVAALLVLGVMQLTTGRSDAVQFCNTTSIIGGGGADPTLPGGGVEGPSTPYPSSISVSGLTGTVTDVNVTLFRITTRSDVNDPPQHWIEDTDVLVSAPNGSNVILMSDAGGNNDVTSGPVVNADLTFDDQAANPLPADSAITSGTYRPVNDDDPIMGNPDIPDEWPAPAPTPSGSTSLATFNGINPNGTWNLFVVDDQRQAATDILGGWCVDIITTGGGTAPTTLPPTTMAPTTLPPTTMAPTTLPPTTMAPTTLPPTTMAPTTLPPTTMAPTTLPPTTMAPTTLPPTTLPPTTLPPTTMAPTTLPPTTVTPTTTAPGTCAGLTPTIVGTSGSDNITGTAGPDVIVGLGGNDQIRGLGGDDVICGGDGNDQILGGPGNDRLFGDAGSDQIFGEDGDDTVSGGPDSDRLSGGNGNDALSGDGGADQCLGDAGTDSASTCESIVGLP